MKTNDCGASERTRHAAIAATGRSEPIVSLTKYGSRLHALRVELYASDFFFDFWRRENVEFRGVLTRGKDGCSFMECIATVLVAFGAFTVHIMLLCRHA